MKIRALLLIPFICALPFTGLTQETPRDIIVNDLMQAELALIEQAKEPTPEPQPVSTTEAEASITEVFTTESVTKEEVIIEGNVITEEATSDNLQPATTEVVEVIVDDNIQVSPEVELVQELKTTPSPTVPSLPKIAAFYYTTDEYLALRGNDNAPQLVLDYDVSTQKTGMLWPVTTKVQIILGEDFAAMKTNPVLGVEITKIYDFKFSRLLTVSAKSGKKETKISFDNISLYAPIYRNITIVRGATQDGLLKTISLGDGQKLDAFWVESAMSWAVNPSEAGLIIKEKPSGLTIYKDKKTVFSAKFADAKYSRKAFKQSLLGFAHHEWPLHPKVLDAFANFTSPPKTFTMLSYSPSALEGETQTWTLVDQQETYAKFPVPTTALSISQRKPISPLVFIIGQAVKGKAFDGAQTREELEADFAAADEAGDDYALWLIGQRYNSYTGICDQDPQADICIRFSKIEENFGSDEAEFKPAKRILKYVKGVRMADDSTQRAQALELLEPFLGEPDVPAIVLTAAAMARAKLKPSELTNPNVTALNPEKLLHAALAKDPYDPNIYLGLAQLNAANEAYEASWDFYDVMRTGAANLGENEFKIDTVEKKLRNDAPGYFAQTK